MLSLNEYIVAYMTVGFTVETLPIKIFNSLRYGYTPTMAAVTVLFVAIAALVFGLDRPLRRPAAAARRLSSDGRLMRIAALADERRGRRRRRQSRAIDAAAREAGRAAPRCWSRRNWP